MRSIYLLVILAACSNDVDPRLITGGGVGDGEIDGEVNVFVIDDNDAPIGNATVRVGAVDQTTNETGLVVFEDVSGPQTISVLAEGHRSVVWVGVNGANVTIVATPLGIQTPDQATLTGSIPGWNAITVPANHIKAALVFYSQSDSLGDTANNLKTPANGNICGVVGQTCDWTLVSRTGTLTVVAAIVDRDTKGTPAEADDTTTIIGWATKSDVTVESGINQSGLMLTMVEAGNLQDVTIDLGTPPAGLPDSAALVGIEVGDDEVIQIPVLSMATTVLAPKPTVFAPDAKYRLTAVAQTPSGNLGAQSILLRRAQTGTALAAGEWLVPPTGVLVTRTDASFERVTGAKVHQVAWLDATDTILEASIFDASTSIDVPSLVALPTSGTLTARVGAIGATLDVGNFSLDTDRDLIFAIAAEPTNVP